MGDSFALGGSDVGQMWKTGLALLIAALVGVSVEGLSCYQDHGNWTQPVARGNPEPCTGGAFCRAVTIKSPERKKSIHLYDCAVTCQAVKDKETVPKGVAGATPVKTSITCCTTDGCNKSGPAVKVSATPAPAPKPVHKPTKKIPSGALSRNTPSVVFTVAVALV